ncbi:AlbA family DNA-binding domain-containing protein [Arthrobacter sp. alpha11c]
MSVQPGPDTETPREIRLVESLVYEYCMVFTPLHRALGLGPSPLSYSMIEAAVTNHVIEAADLDWKRALPNKDPKASREFAKDIAAMVNAGGGIIVYGVAEDATSSAAETVTPVVDWSDSVQTKLLGWAYSLIQPPVHGLEFKPLMEDGATETQVVVLQIPASFETPHFVITDDTIRAPRRYGPRTVFMSERDIEQAYRLRFEDRRNHERSLTELVDRVLLGANQSNKAWLAAAARPVNPRPSYAGRVSEEDARSILGELMTRNPFLKDAAGMEVVSLVPKPGYRKWRSTEPEGNDPYSIVDIHDDGSVALATAGHPYEATDFSGYSDVLSGEAQALSAHIIHLMRSAAEQLDVVGDYEVLMTIKSPDPVMYIRTYDTSLHSLTDRSRLAPIHLFQPVVGLVAGRGDVSEALGVVRNLALDVLNQGGIRRLGHVYLKDKI